MEFTAFEEHIIKSICTQLENISKGTAIIHSEAADVYKEGLNILTIALCSKLDPEKALGTLKKLNELKSKTKSN